MNAKQRKRQHRFLLRRLELFAKVMAEGIRPMIKEESLEEFDACLESLREVIKEEKEVKCSLSRSSN